nr:unnamed protein product [Digitaria exilis]
MAPGAAAKMMTSTTTTAAAARRPRRWRAAGPMARGEEDRAVSGRNGTRQTNEPPAATAEDESVHAPPPAAHK